MMHHIDYDEPGRPSVLRLQTGPLPVPTRGQVLIEVAAAGVNRPDILQRQGRYPPPEDASPILGLEVAGTVAAVGPGVRQLKVGQRICALTHGGGYAEYVCAPEEHCLVMSDSLSFVQAAALPEALFTVWANVYDRGGLKPGQSLLVHGGTGGIGSIAIQMGRITGARVYATAGSDEKCTICQGLGAVRAVNYRSEDFVEVIRLATGRGADVILDSIGGSYIQRNILAAATDGRIVNIAFQQSPIAEVNFMRVLVKRLTLTGTTLRSRSHHDKALIAQHLRAKLWPAVCAGRIAPLIAGTYPLAEAAMAHEELEEGRVVGKLVLTI